MIWLDVTTIAAWNRPAVGIIRTEAECARHFLTQKDVEVRFCHFESSTRRYREIDREFVAGIVARLDTIRAHQHRASQAAPAAQSTPAAPVPGPTKQQRLKTAGMAMINKLPRGLRSRAFRFASERREAFYCTMQAARELRQAWRVLKAPPAQAGIPSSEALVPEGPGEHPFREGDVYVSLGLDWGQNRDYAFLYQEKQRLGFKVVFFCYDIIPIRRPHLCVGDVASIFGRYFSDLAWCADRILCISDYSRRDLKAFLEEIGAPVPELAVVRLGSELPDAGELTPAPEIAALKGQRYVLFVSTIERRKNHETLYRAYTRLIDQGMTDMPLLVFVGMPGWGVSDLMLDLQLDPRIKPYLRVFNNMSDDDLGFLYRHAYMTAFPSLFEGWGLPVAESLSYGKFCLASHAASIPEVAGDLLEYLDPWDVPAWTERLGYYFQHPEAVAEKERRIRAEYRPTAWSETGHFVLDQAIAASQEAQPVHA